MELPTSEAERHREFRNLIRSVERASREERNQRHRRNRLWLLNGTNTNEPAMFNRLLKFVKDSSSLLYSPSFARFDLISPTEYGDFFLEEEEAARDVLHRLWQDSEAALTAQMLVEAAHWQDTAVAKVYVDRNEPVLDMISNPSDVCVARESLNSWDRQEVLVHFYVQDLASITRALALRYGPESETFQRLIAEARGHAEPGAESGRAGLTAAQSNILLLAASPSMQGNVQDLTDTPFAIPSETEELVRMAEAWVWDDHAHPKCRRCGKAKGATFHRHDLTGMKGVHTFEQSDEYEGDYRVVTMFVATDEILFDSVNPLLAGKHPFHPLCLNVIPGYLWGIAPFEPLIPLVSWREERIAQIREGLDKQFDPPIVGTGLQGINDEKLLRMRRKGSALTSAMPGGKVEPFLIPMPPDAFAEVEKIDQMIDEIGGLPSRVTGQSDPNTRSGDQLMSGATLGAGPSLSRAMIVEAWISSVATDMIRLQRRVSRTPIRKANGEEFLLAHLPSEIVAEIAAHSASPIYQQQILPKVAFAAQQKWIDGEEGVELLQLPGSAKLRAKARKLGQQQAEKADRMMKAKEGELAAKAHKAEADARKR